MKWENFLVFLRIDLQDTDDLPRWEDNLLWLYTIDAIRDYSNYFPRRNDSVKLQKDSEGYSLPSNFVYEILVECPKNTILKRYQKIPGTIRRAIVQRYYIEGTSVYLTQDTSEDLYITYMAVHTFPMSETDNNFIFTVPERDLELIRLYVKALIHIQLRTKTSRLDRFDIGSGRRDDNPLMPETRDMMKDYYKKIADRLGGGVINLYRGR